MILLQINNETEPAWRCQARVYPAPVTFRRIRYPDFGTPDRLEETVHGKTSYSLDVFLSGRVLMCWTDAPVEASTVSGINTTAQAIQLKTGESVSCWITDREPTDEEQEFIQHERLIAASSQRAGTQVAVRSMANPLTATAKEIREQIYTLNKTYSVMHGEDMFKATNESMKALANLDTSATDKQKYADFIDAIYFLIYEGSGACKRLGDPVPAFAIDVKFLRTALRHDLDHGNEKEIATKMKRAGETFMKYSTKHTPEECNEDDFIDVQSKLLVHCLGMLKNLNLK